MRKVLLALMLVTAASPVTAQVIPEPGIPDPRIQTARWIAGQQIDLTAMPGTALTIVFEPGETITQVTADASAIDTRVSHAQDSLQLYPSREGDLGLVRVETDRRAYTFALRTDTGLMAAYLVRLTSQPLAQAPPTQGPLMPLPGFGPAATHAAAEIWSYRLRGDRSVRPSAITDDGTRTTIQFPEDRALPAIFAIGPSGKEQLVNGYMRGGAFVIDRVWQELVFRIDGEKATARRNDEPDARDG